MALEKYNPKPVIVRSKQPRQRPTKEERQAIKRAVKRAPAGSAAAEWGPNPDLNHGSLKRKTPRGAVTPG